MSMTLLSSNARSKVENWYTSPLTSSACGGKMPACTRVAVLDVELCDAVTAAAIGAKAEALCRFHSSVPTALLPHNLHVMLQKKYLQVQHHLFIDLVSQPYRPLSDHLDMLM